MTKLQDAGEVGVQAARPDSCTQRITGAKTAQRQRMIKKVRYGLAFSAFEKLRKAMRLPKKDLADILQIPMSSLWRRKKQGRFTTAESDRIVRITMLIDQATQLMDGDREAALQWLQQSLDILGNETPLQHVDTELGARDVEELIGRLRHAAFS